MESYKSVVGKRIKMRRKEMGFATQQAFADAIQLDQPRINKWETGASLPGAKNRKLICEVLKVSPEALFSVDLAPAGHNRAELLSSIVLLLPLLSIKNLETVLKFVNSLQASPSKKVDDSG